MKHRKGINITKILQEKPLSFEDVTETTNPKTGRKISKKTMHKSVMRWVKGK